MKTEWIGVPGYEYTINNNGEVKNKKGKKIYASFLPGKTKKKESYRYRIAFGGRNWILHTLVYKVFNNIDLKEKIKVFFLDGKAKNVFLDNLSVNCKKEVVDIKGEEWKDILSASGYVVSNMARIAQRISGKLYLVKTSVYSSKKNGNGKFLAFSLPRHIHKNTWLSVKKVVSQAFCDNTFAKSHVVNIDGDFKNCLPGNLRVIKKSYILSESITMLQDSAQRHSNGGLASLDVMMERGRSKLDQYIESNYEYWMSRVEPLAYSMRASKQDVEDATHCGLMEIEQILKNGNYTGGTRLKYFISGVIKNRIRRVREKNGETVSCFGINKSGESFFVPDLCQSHFMPDGSQWSAHA